MKFLDQVMMLLSTILIMRTCTNNRDMFIISMRLLLLLYIWWVPGIQSRTVDLLHPQVQRPTRFNRPGCSFCIEYIYYYVAVPVGVSLDTVEEGEGEVSVSSSPAAVVSTAVGVACPAV